MQGVVKWFDPRKNFGFIKRETGEDLFVHCSAIRTGYRTLEPGQRVEFDVAQGRKGLEAKNVVLATATSLRLRAETPSLLADLSKLPGARLYESQVFALPHRPRPERVPEKRSTGFVAQAMRDYREVQRGTRRIRDYGMRHPLRRLPNA